MFYRLLFFVSVILGVVYDFISKEKLDIDSLVFLMIVFLVGLKLLILYSLYFKFFHNLYLKKKIKYIALAILFVGSMIFFSIELYYKILAISISGLSLLFINRKISLSWIAILRSSITVAGLCLIFECFSTSDMSQITSGYYAIPVGEFIFTSVVSDSGRSGKSGILVTVLSFIVLVLILAKDILIQWVDSYVILGFLLIILCVLMFVFTGIKHTRLRKVNVLFIAVSIVILFYYDAKPMAIVGSVLLSLSDMIMSRFTFSDFRSENISFFIGCVLSSLVGLLVRYSDVSWWRWFAIGTSDFPIEISVEQIGWLLIVSAINIAIQFILIICFTNRSLIKFIPLRYLDLCIVNLVKGSAGLAASSLLLSSLFAYFL